MKSHPGRTGDHIPVAGPLITQADIDAVTNAVTTCWYDGVGKPVTEFEQAFAAYVGRKYAAALPSCTSALHLAALALDLKPGDEVVVPDATWIASAVPFTYVGATIVFADVDPDTWVITRESLEKVVTKNTKCVVPVNLYGGMPEYDEILEFCRERGIAVVEDAAESVGSLYKKKKSGSFGDISVFSFHGSKTLVTDEGGMLLTDNKALFDRVNFLRDHGRRVGDRTFFHEEIAYKYKMSSLQAALGRSQLSHVDELVDIKRAIFGWYKDRLSDLPLKLNAEPPNVYNSYWMATVVWDKSLGISKEAFQDQLLDSNIASRPFFYPLSELPAFSKNAGAGLARTERPVSYQLGQYGVNLPCAAILEEDDVDIVCNVVRKIFENA